MTVPHLLDSVRFGFVSGVGNTADERLFEENKRRLETDGLRDRLSQVERFNTEVCV